MKRNLTYFHGDLFYFYIQFYLSFLALFIPALIWRIWSNPSAVKCFFSFISSAALHQSSKSRAFTPWIRYFWKNGMIFWVRSSNLMTIIITAFSECLYREPQPRYFIIKINKASSLECWPNWKTSWTVSPSLYLWDLTNLIMNEPSASVIPASHSGSIVVGSSTKGLSTGTTSGRGKQFLAWRINLNSSLPLEQEFYVIHLQLNVPFV